MCVVGDDADLCSELLQESLDALRALPEATLFDEGTVSSVWLEVVERATKFLRSVIYWSASNSVHHTVFFLIPCYSNVSPPSGSVMYTEVPPPKATFRSRTSTWLWPSFWSWPCRGARSGHLHTRHTCRLDPCGSPTVGEMHHRFTAHRISVAVSLQSAAVCRPAAAPPVGKRHQGDGQRALHPGDQRPSAAPPPTLPEHTQHQGGAHP